MIAEDVADGKFVGALESFMRSVNRSSSPVVHLIRPFVVERKSPQHHQIKAYMAGNCWLCNSCNNSESQCTINAMTDTLSLTIKNWIRSTSLYAKLIKSASLRATHKTTGFLGRSRNSYWRLDAMPELDHLRLTMLL